MHPFVKQFLDREKEQAQAFQFALKKAFDLLGGMYAPLFFCAACLMGIALPFLAWKSGDVVNALLGARGVGVLTSELTRGMWMMIVAIAIFFGSNLLLTRLQGKMHEVFTTLAYICEIVALLVLSTSATSVFIVHALLIFAWRVFPQKRVRGGIAVVWFLGLAWMFFVLATDVALRVSTIGYMVSLLALTTLFFCAVTRPLFEEK
jgi:hypothetical protein